MQQDAAWSIVEHRLDNGLRVVVSPDRVAPVVAVNVTYDVGSRHEAADRTGLAHLFEHLMFQGSANVAPSEHFAAVQGVGGTLNGTTSFDRTNYFESVPTNAFELALWLEADRMGTLLAALTQDNLDNQRDVVKNERRQRYDNVPYGTAWERLFAMAFPATHPYHHMPIGSMAHLDAASLADCRAFFKTYYAPGNATVVVVGDVDTAAAIDAVTRLFGGIPPGPDAPAAPDGGIGPATAEVRDELVTDVPAPAVYALYRLPADGADGVEAAELAMRVLAGGESSRLQRRLQRRDQLAQSVSAGVVRMVGGTSVGSVVAKARSGVATAAIDDAIDAELAALAADGPTAEELARALALAEHDWLDATATVMGRADELNRWATLHGAPQLAVTALDRLRAVSAADVQALAAERLVPANRAVLTYQQEASS